MSRPSNACFREAIRRLWEVGSAVVRVGWLLNIAMEYGSLVGGDWNHGIL